MEIGPLNVSEINYFKELFESKKVPYEIVIDKDLEEQIMAEFHANVDKAPRTAIGTLDLRIVFFQIADEDFDKVKQGLENYGITVSSDGSYELGEE